MAKLTADEQRVLDLARELGSLGGVALAADEWFSNGYVALRVAPFSGPIDLGVECGCNPPDCCEPGYSHCPADRCMRPRYTRGDPLLRAAGIPDRIARLTIGTSHPVTVRRDETDKGDLTCWSVDREDGQTTLVQRCYVEAVECHGAPDRWTACERTEIASDLEARWVVLAWRGDVLVAAVMPLNHSIRGKRAAAWHPRPAAAEVQP